MAFQFFLRYFQPRSVLDCYKLILNKFETMADESQTSGGATGNNNSTSGPAPASSSEYIKLRVVGQVQFILNST